MFARGTIETEVFHRNVSQLSHFSTPFVGTQTFFDEGIYGGFSQKFFRNSVNLRPPLSARENFSRGMIGTEVFHKKFRHSVFLAPLYLHAKKHFEGVETEVFREIFATQPF